MADERRAPGWVGPVVGAIILVGGYVAYRQWDEYHAKHEACAALKRTFVSNMNAMIGPANAATARSLAADSQAPMSAIGGSVAANQQVVDALNAKCPGWEKQPD